MTGKQKISTQANSDTWQAIKILAAKEGRNTDSLVNEAFEMLIEQRESGNKIRKSVMDIYKTSLEDYDELYKLLAK